MLEGLFQSVVDGDIEGAGRLTREALGAGIAPAEIFRRALVPGMAEVGKRMQAEEYYIPEVLLSSRAMKASSEILRPLTAQGRKVEPVGRVVFGTVRGDLHDIGKNLVATMMEGAGFEVIDLGTNVPVERFVEKTLEIGPDIVAMSALLTTTMVGMRAVVEGLREVGCRDRVKVMIGGAPVTPRFAEEIGADGYAPEAAAATEMARRLVAPRDARDGR